MDFAIRADDWVKIHYARELRKQLSTKMTGILTAIGALWTVLEGLEREPEELEIGGRIEII